MKEGGGGGGVGGGPSSTAVGEGVCMYVSWFNCECVYSACTVLSIMLRLSACML